MNRQEYLAALYAALEDQVPVQEQANIMRYYEEYFDEAGAEHEAEVVAELGDPRELVRRIVEENGFDVEMERSRRRNKNTVGIAAIIIIVAAVLVIAFTALGSQYGEEYVVEYIGNAANGTTFTLDSFSDIDLDLAVADVRIELGEAYTVTLSWNPAKDYYMDFDVDGDLLTVTGKSSYTGIGGNLNSTVLITVPEGESLGDLWLDVDMGDVTLDGAIVQSLDIQADMGDVTVIALSAGGAVYLNCDMGDVDIKLLTADQAEIEANMGQVTIENSLVTDFLWIENDMGDVRLGYTLWPALTEINVDMGNIEVEANCAAADLAYELECDMGSVTVNGQNFKKYTSKSGGQYELFATADMGNISVNFQG